MKPANLIPRNNSVLIADDDPELLTLLKMRLSRLGLNVSTVSNGLSALVKLVKLPPDLFIVDLNMPGEDGLSVCEHVSSKSDQKFPIILLTGTDNAETRQRCKDIGAHFICKGPTVWDDLRPLLFDLLQLGRTTHFEMQKPVVNEGLQNNRSLRPKILLVDDHLDFTRTFISRLQNVGAEPVLASSGAQGYIMALSHQPKLIVIDYTIPDGGADYLVMRLQQGSTTRNIPIILLMGRTSDGRTDDGLQRELLSRGGVVGHHTKPVDFNLLLDDITSRVRSMRTRPLLRAAQ